MLVSFPVFVYSTCLDLFDISFPLFYFFIYSVNQFSAFLSQLFFLCCRRVLVFRSTLVTAYPMNQKLCVLSEDDTNLAWSVIRPEIQRSVDFKCFCTFAGIVINVSVECSLHWSSCFCLSAVGTRTALESKSTSHLLDRLAWNSRFRLTGVGDLKSVWLIVSLLFVMEFNLQ